MKAAFFWYFTQRRIVVLTDVSGQPIRPIFNSQTVQELLLSVFNNVHLYKLCANVGM